MPSDFPRSPKLLKGALIQFSAPLLIPIPNIIIFQYNPESLARKLTAWAPPARDEHGNIDPKIEATLAQPYDPHETFDLALELDAADALEQPSRHPVAVISGVADRRDQLIGGRPEPLGRGSGGCGGRTENGPDCLVLLGAGPHRSCAHCEFFGGRTSVFPDTLPNPCKSLDRNENSRRSHIRQ